MPMIYVPAGEDLREAQDRFVTFSLAGLVVLPENGGEAVGVLKRTANVGEEAGVFVNGTTSVAVDGVLPSRRMVATTAEGKARVAQPGEVAHGYSAESSNGSAAAIAVDLQRLGPVGVRAGADGVPVVRLAPPERQRATTIGRRFNASASKPTVFDVSFDDDRDLLWVVIETAKATAGDYVELELVDADQGDRSFAPLAETVYIPPAGRVLLADVDEEIGGPVRLRVRYVPDSQGAGEREVYLQLRMRR